MAKEIKIKVGDEVFCTHRKAVEGGETPGMPIKGRIIGITARLNRQIAVQLTEKVTGGHDCDGRGDDGYCLWTRPWHILTPAEWELKKKQMEDAAKAAAQIEEDVEELVLRNV